MLSVLVSIKQVYYKSSRPRSTVALGMQDTVLRVNIERQSWLYMYMIWNTTLLVALRSAPRFSNSKTTLYRPSLAARCNAVSPFYNTESVAFSWFKCGTTCIWSILEHTVYSRVLVIDSCYGELEMSAWSCFYFAYQSKIHYKLSTLRNHCSKQNI